jgi:hypothetical protein
MCDVKLDLTANGAAALSAPLGRARRIEVAAQNGGSFSMSRETSMSSLNFGHLAVFIVLSAIAWLAGIAAWRKGRTAKITTGIVLLLLGLLGFFMHGFPNKDVGVPPLEMESQFFFAAMAMIFGMGGIIVLI